MGARPMQDKIKFKPLSRRQTVDPDMAALIDAHRGRLGVLAYNPAGLEVARRIWRMVNERLEWQCRGRTMAQLRRQGINRYQLVIALGWLIDNGYILERLPGKGKNERAMLHVGKALPAEDARDGGVGRVE